MLHKVVRYLNNPILERPADPVTAFDTPELHTLVEDMFETMYASHGIGLAGAADRRRQEDHGHRRGGSDDEEGKAPEKIVLIAAIGAEARGGTTFDARGLLVVPGVVDIHGDAFERQLQPRPGVDFSPDVALVDTEAQLLANGITTAFHGVTLSWEPGLRSANSWIALLASLPGARSWTCDMRVHLRWEASKTSTPWIPPSPPACCAPAIPI